MDYPVLHKDSGIVIGMCFLIADKELLEGEWGFFYINSDGVVDASTVKLVKVERVSKRSK
jgi:hypothetical protein